MLDKIPNQIFALWPFPLVLFLKGVKSCWSGLSFIVDCCDVSLVCLSYCEGKKENKCVTDTEETRARERDIEIKKERAGKEKKRRRKKKRKQKARN